MTQFVINENSNIWHNLWSMKTSWIFFFFLLFQSCLSNHEITLWVRENMSSYVGCSCFIHGFNSIVVWTMVAGVARFAKYDIIIATLNIKNFPKMRETSHQACMRAWYVIQKKICEKHVKWVKVGRSALLMKLNMKF